MAQTKKNKDTKSHTIKKKAPRVTAPMLRFLETAKEIGIDYAMKKHNWSNEKLHTLLRGNMAFFNKYHKYLGLTPIQVKFLRVFKKRICNVSKTCDAVGIRRRTYYDWLNNNPVFKENALALKSALADDLETVMFNRALVDKSDTMLIWMSKVHLRDRGYVEKIQQDVTVNPFLELMKKASTVDEE